MNGVRKLTLTFSLAIALPFATASGEPKPLPQSELPNILLLMAEDMSPRVGAR